MITPEKIAANRRNAQKSTGPADTTSTRYNAAKHGLLAQGVTELDDADAYRHLLASLTAEYRPVGPIETFLVESIALDMLRIRRARRLEADHITAALNPPITERTSNDITKLLAELEDTEKIVDPGLPASLSAATVCELADGFSRYETMIENRLYRALNQLRFIQAARVQPA